MNIEKKEIKDELNQLSMINEQLLIFNKKLQKCIKQLCYGYSIIGLDMRYLTEDDLIKIMNNIKNIIDSSN